MRAWLKARMLRLRRDDFPWPHWELANERGASVLLWPWVRPLDDKEGEW